MARIAGKHITVVGAARSGLSAARALVSLGATVTLSDSRPASELPPDRVAQVTASGAIPALGAPLAQSLQADTELVVTSPGVPRNAEILRHAEARGIAIWSEIELAYRLSAAPIVAITGTNGKTTTTLLAAQMLTESGIKATVAGNISADEIKRTLVDAVMETRCSPSASVIVAEISSFQLEWVERFAPKVAALLNVTEDHMNRYSGLQDYTDTKARIFAAQSTGQFAVLNADDATCRELGGRSLAGHRIWFTRSPSPASTGGAVWIRDNSIIARMHPDAPAARLLDLAAVPPSLPGAHNIENILAAAAIAFGMRATQEAIERAVSRFLGVPHRMEMVEDIAGVRFINNSMCSNIAAAICSLQALDRPAVVIAGGSDKGLDFSPLAPVLLERARCVILIGQAAARMEMELRRGGYTNITGAASMPAAVSLAQSRAVAGDTVILCPACASFDMFADFEARGSAFRQAVRELRREAP